MTVLTTEEWELSNGGNGDDNVQRQEDVGEELVVEIGWLDNKLNRLDEIPPFCSINACQFLNKDMIHLASHDPRDVGCPSDEVRGAEGPQDILPVQQCEQRRLRQIRTLLHRNAVVVHSRLNVCLCRASEQEGGSYPAIASTKSRGLGPLSVTPAEEGRDDRPPPPCKNAS